jgi:putative salt-induced outer membrane protein YdiY
MRFVKTAVAALVATASMGSYAAEEKSDSKWTADVAAGMVLERGNTDSNSVNGNFNAAHEGDLWRNTMKLEASNKEERTDVAGYPGLSKYVRTDERYYGLYQLDRKFNSHSANYLFNVGTYEKDAFSGFQYQGTYAVGLGRRWIDAEKHTLDAELGPGYRWQCLEKEDNYFQCNNDENETIVRVAAKYQWVISESADFRQEVSSDIGREAASTRAESIFNSKINSHFSLRLRYLVEHETEVAAGSKESDHEFTIGLVYTIR